MFERRAGTVLWRCSSSQRRIFKHVTVYYRGSLVQDDRQNSVICESPNLTGMWELTLKSNTLVDMKSNSSCGVDRHLSTP